MKPSTAVGALAVLGLAIAGCESSTGDAGCQVTRSITLPPTPLTLMDDVRLERTDAGYVLLGSDATVVRWATLKLDGTLGTEHTLPLPQGVTDPMLALARTTAPWDTVLVGYLVAANNDTELRLLTAPTDGSSPPAMSDAPLLTFPVRLANHPPVAFGTSRDGGPAGLAWVDKATNTVSSGTVDGRGQMVSGPLGIGEAPSISCLAFTSGTGNLTVSYLRAAQPGALQTWVKTELLLDGSFSNLTMTVAHARATMGCGLGTPLMPASSGYALAWQDASGSWLSVYGAPPAGSTSLGGVVTYPFASATDFGGPNLQPPIVGIAPFGTDFGVMFAMVRSVELWRLDRTGHRREGALVLPSREGRIGKVTTTPSAGGGLTATYADYTGNGSAGSTPAGRRLVVDAACY